MNKLLLIFFLTALFSCNPQKKVADKANDHKVKNLCMPVLGPVGETKMVASDFFTLDSLAVTEDCLWVLVSYSGGCGGADFRLFASGKVKYSMPPQADLLLHFTDNDPCRELVQDTLHFDLSTFTQLAEDGGIWLGLKGLDKRVLYKH